MNDNESMILLPKRLMTLSLQNIDGWRTYNEYVCILKKRIKCHLRIRFISKCIQADIIPRFLKFRVPENGCFVPQVVHNFQRNLLKAELAKAKKLMEDHDSEFLERRTALRNAVPSKLIPSIVFISHMAVAKVRNSVESTHGKSIK